MCRLKLVDAQLDRCTTKLHTHMVARLNASDPTHTPTAQEAELREHLDQLMCELVAAKSAHTQDVSRWGEQRSALQDRVQHLESVRDSSRKYLSIGSVKRGGGACPGADVWVDGFGTACWFLGKSYVPDCMHVHLHVPVHVCE